MKLLPCLFLLSLISASSWGQEAMTAKLFEKLVAAQGDARALRPEIALLPHFKIANGTVVLKYPNGTKLEEKCRQTSKTINGNYIVYAITSDSLEKPSYAIAGYDVKASAIHLWSLTGADLCEGTIVIDSARKILASTATFGDGLMEITVGNFSTKEEYEHTLTYKNGVLIMTREVTLCPVSPTKEVEQPGTAQPATKPADKTPVKDQPSTPTSKVSPR
jgi:hypothetical protein